MGYQWGTPTTPSFDVRQDAVNIHATKSGGGDTLSMTFLLTDVGFEGDTFPSEQTFADILGLLVDALEGDGFTVQVTEPGSVSRQLNEVP